jgi:phosphomannomutase
MECPKLLNEKRNFNGIEGKKIPAIAEAEAFEFSDVDSLGEITENMLTWIFILMRY